MKKFLLKLISLSLAIIMIVCVSPLSIAIGELVSNDNAISSSSKGTSSILTTQAAKSYDENAKVCLIQDALPWDSDANTVILDQIGIPYNIDTTSEFLNDEIWKYDVVIFANDQSFATYNNYKAFKEQLELFTQMGGVIVFGAGDFGWADGEITTDLPGGLKKKHNYCYNNYIVDAQHPIVTGELTNDGVLTDNELYEYYCSHNSFVESTIPKGGKVILRASNDGAPTLIEYPIGNGTIIASTLTWEFNYYHGGDSHPQGGNRGRFAEIAMKDMFLYAISKGQKSAENKFNVYVEAINSNGKKVAVKDAFVSVYDNSNGQTSLLYTTKTDSNGMAGVSVTGLTVNQLKNLTISAYINDNIGANIDGDDRNALFNNFGITETGDPIRFIYQLRSEKIDFNGNWIGAKLPNSIEDTIKLTLSEPRLLVNLAVSYLVDTQVPDYVQRIKDSMSYASELMAQSTDGHIMFNKIILVPTTNRLNFADINNTASMADIQIQATLTDGNNSNMQIWSNAYVTGYYYDDTVGFDVSCFQNIPENAFLGRDGYYRVQMSGLEGAGWNNEIGTEAYATTICHELGHYLLGLFDEYMDGNEDNWDEWYGPFYYHKCPYPERFGLMDNQHYDIELSRNSRDYAYLNGDFSKPNKNTAQSFYWKESCENSVRDLLTSGNVDGSTTFSFASGKYKANYTMSPSSTKDRTAEYSYAALSDSDFTTVNSRIVSQLNTQAAENTNDLFYGYVSDSNCVIGYLSSTQRLTAKCSKGNNLYTNGQYKSVNEAVVVTASSSGTISGEFYAEVGSFRNIDFSTLSWYKYYNGKWEKVTSDISRDNETMNFRVRCNYVGNGTYVIMAKNAADATLHKVSIVSHTNSKYKDAETSIVISDKNDVDKLIAYNIYYADYEFNTITDDVTTITVYPGSNEYTILFKNINSTYYVRVEAVAIDGSKSALSDSYIIFPGIADSDNDGVPDWYCDKYLLWGEDDSKNIAESDENGNGLTNLEEYLAGNDPTKFSESNIDIVEESISMNYRAVKTLNIIYAPGKDIIYESSNEKVAVVDENGIIKAVGEGTAIITATVADLGVSDSCNITVTYTWWQWIIRILLLGFLWY